MRVALAVVSLLVLIGCGVVVYDQFHSRWEDNQTAYFHQALAQAKTGAERASLEDRQPKIEQTIVTAFGDQRIDRCESCHIAVDDPRFTSGEAAADHASLFRSDGRRVPQWPLGAPSQVHQISAAHPATTARGAAWKLPTRTVKTSSGPTPCSAIRCRQAGARRSPRTCTARNSCRPTARNATPERILRERRW